jgi:hypothetical protein
MGNSDSSKLERLQEYLSQRELDFVSDIKVSHGPGVDFAIFVSSDRVAKQAGKGCGSFRQMRMLQKSIRKELGIAVEWIVLPGDQAAVIETALREALNARYPNMFTAAYVSSPKMPPIYVWLEPKPQAKKPPEIGCLRVLCEDLFKVFGLGAPTLILGETEELPTNPTILRSLKIYSPALVEELAGHLRSSGSLVPHVRWLETKLDTLRRNGLVSRSSDGKYSLTELALSTVPYGRSRSSSDVERALALGRRKW